MPLPLQGEITGDTEIQLETPSGNTYKLTGVLALKDDVIDHGASGAPVIDPETGVAFAMIVAKLERNGPPAGFAIPFSRIKQHAPVLSNLFEANRKAVPRFGRFLNHLGAIALCRRQRGAVVQQLIRGEYFLPALYCERAAEARVGAFLESQSLIMPIVDNSGVGKTMLLSQVAQRSENKPVLLLLARYLRQDEGDLPTALNARLQNIAPRLFGNPGDVALLVNALRADRQPLIVLLDGLNEIPAQLSGNLQTWIEGTVAWVEETQTKLIVSSRPEFWQVWQSLFPRRLIFRDEASKQNANAVEIQLGDFSREEAEKARAAYGLRGFLSARDLRHPMIVRIYWEMQREKGQGELPTTRYRVLQHFIGMKCERIAQALAPQVIRPYVEEALYRVARATLAKGRFEIAAEAFFQLFSENPDLANRLIQEGLFTSAGSNIRFAFDEVAEFLHGQLLDLAALTDLLRQEGEQHSRLTSGTVLYAILRLDDQEHFEEVKQALAFMCDLYADQKTSSIALEYVFVQLLQQVREPGRFTEEIATMARLMAPPDSYMSDYLSFRATIAQLALPLTFKFEVLKLFLIQENSYEFEHHHWKDLDRYAFSKGRHTASILVDLMRGAPVPAFRILVNWLSDTTRLREGKSEISDAAMALMFFYRHLAFDALCEMLAHSEGYPAMRLLLYILEHDLNHTLALCSSWVDGQDDRLRAVAAFVASSVPTRSATDEALEDRLYELFSRLQGTVAPEVEVTIKLGIGRLKKYRQTVIHELLALFKAGHSQLSGYTLLEWVETSFNETISAVGELMKSDQKRAQALEALVALCGGQYTPPEKKKIMRLLRLGVSKGLLTHYDFRLAIEKILYGVTSEAEASDIFRLVKQIVDFSPEVRMHLMYFATAHYGREAHENKLKDEILDLLITHETDDNNRRHLIERLAVNYSEERGPLGYLVKIGEGMEPERFHYELIIAAQSYKQFATALVAWLQADTLLSPFGPTQRLLDKVQDGADPYKAAESIFWEMVSPSE
ncbi:MAG: hypothetical protein ACJ74G_15590 [Blastocatellia bacterium]